MPPSVIKETRIPALENIYEARQQEIKKIHFQIHPSNELPQIHEDSNQHTEKDSIPLIRDYEYFIEVTPHGQTFTKQFKEMSYENRNCLLSTEISDTPLLKVNVMTVVEFQC